MCLIKAMQHWRESATVISQERNKKKKKKNISLQVPAF